MRCSPDDDDTRDKSLYTDLWDRLARQTPELIARARERREDIDLLYRELMQAAPHRQLRKVRETRFRSLDLLDRLLEESHDLQLSQPAQAVQHARLAIVLGTAFKENKVEAVSALPRAFCLGANALRLDSWLAAADEMLTQGSLFLADRLERAFYSRTLAVLRWEQARTDEAQALLRHALRLYEQEDLNSEAALCRLLLGLVLLETEGSEDALSTLTRSWPNVDREAQPLPALRGGLALASMLAQAGQADRARQILRETWGLYSGVSDPKEMSRVFWWEGRVLASLGDPSEALDLLESVRQNLLAEPSAAEAALVSLDLARALVETGRGREAEVLADDLEKHSGSTVPFLALAAEGIRSFASPGPDGSVDFGNSLELTLRRAFRASAMGMRPFPVV